MNDQASVRRRESQVVLSDQGDRYLRAWLPERPERVLVLVHGFGEHSGRYDEMAMHFARRGFAVYAFDQAGHGRTPGPRGHVDRFDRLPLEVARLVETLRVDHAGCSLTLLGHSMGGLVVAAAAALHGVEADRLVLSGALLQLAPEGDGIGRRLSLAAARALSVVLPRIGTGTGLDAEGLSRDLEVVRRYREDPLVHDRMTTRFAAGMSQMMTRVAAADGRVERPILVLHGERDPIVAAQGSQ